MHFLQRENKNLPIPKAEFISNHQAVPDITNFHNRVKYNLERKDRHIHSPQKIEVDYNLTLIHVVNSTDNQTSTAEYIRKIWDNEPISCVIHMCSVHVMHTIASKA